jgi:hypothetical protein
VKAQDDSRLLNEVIPQRAVAAPRRPASADLDKLSLFSGARASTIAADDVKRLRSKFPKPREDSQMKNTGYGDRTSSTASARLGVGSWIILIVLLSLLVATGVVIHFGWTLGNGTDMPASGYAAMALGVIISLAVGFGLMALIFYSSRKGYDEPPALIVTENDSTESKDVPETE